MSYQDLYQQSIEQPEVSIPPTIDDPVILDEIRDVMRERGIGQYALS